MRVRAWVSRRLERGGGFGPAGRVASEVWARTASVERPLRWREGAAVVAVGGATLGGSGKTPLAIACARALRRAGADVALVGHAYRARPGRPRIVSPDDPLDEVGDEALECARALAAEGVPVVVAPDRQRALDRALESADVAVIDGLGQARPRRVSLALLAVDAASPWGAGSCPPQGDLRAPEAVLRAAADRVVEVGGEAPPRAGHDRAVTASEGAWLDDRLLGWSELRARRVGLMTSLARPDRVLAMLASRGVRPVRTAFAADHDALAAERRNSSPEDVDLWICTPKCAPHLGSRPSVAVLDFALRLSPHLESELERLLRAVSVTSRSGRRS